MEWNYSKARVIAQKAIDDYLHYARDEDTCYPVLRQQFINLRGKLNDTCLGNQCSPLLSKSNIHFKKADWDKDENERKSARATSIAALGVISVCLMNPNIIGFTQSLKEVTV